MILGYRRARHVVTGRGADGGANYSCRSPVGSVMAGYDVDDAADRVGSIERRALWTANDLDALDGFWSELGNEQRICELESIDVHLRVAGSEGASAANAPIVGEQGGRRALPDPHPRHHVAQRLPQIALGVTRQLRRGNGVHGDRQRARAGLDCVSIDDYSIQRPGDGLITPPRSCGSERYVRTPGGHRQHLGPTQ